MKGLEKKLLVDRVAIALDVRYREFELRVREVVASKIRPLEHEESDAAGITMVRAIGESGLLDACVDLDVPAICILREAIAYASGLADSMVALQALGYGPISIAGSDAQRAAWRDRVKRGDAVAAVAITEPEAGSDVAAIATSAKRAGDGWVLRGTKCFITNAGIAEFYVVFARTGEPGSKGLSAFLVTADRVKVVEKYRLIAPHPCGEIAFEDVELPADALIGEEGAGFKLAMSTLDHCRVTVAAAALGMAERAFDEAIARAKSRKQFGKPIGEFQQIGAMLADSFAELEAARLLVYRAADAHAAHDPAAGMLSSAAKLLATESAQRIIDRAVQIHGGQGVREGTAVERLYREIRALRIYEGTTEIQRVVLSRGVLG